MPEYKIPLGFRFRVEFEDIPTKPNPDDPKAPKPEVPPIQSGKDVRFQEVTGLSMELGIETLDEGGLNGYSHRLPTRAKYENLVLKRGMLTDTALMIWITDAIENFLFTPATVTVILLDENKKSLASWQFKNAWPVKWSVSDFKAQENALVIETLELAYSHFTYRKG
ncbi:MAG: phage tail protein [Bacteroidetes bacterium]|nr:phage tail protein [Bacteroidota bacterium]